MSFRQLEVSVDSAPGAVTVRIAGDVTADSIDRMRQGIAMAISQKQPKLILDLSQTSFLSSPGLAVLVQTLQLTARGGGKLILAAPNERVRGIFEISRLTDVFTIAPTYEDALAR